MVTMKSMILVSHDSLASWTGLFLVCKGRSETKIKLQYIFLVKTGIFPYSVRPCSLISKYILTNRSTNASGIALVILHTVASPTARVCHNLYAFFIYRTIYNYTNFTIVMSFSSIHWWIFTVKREKRKIKLSYLMFLHIFIPALKLCSYNAWFFSSLEVET